jgi:hypothetical protein
VKPAELKRPSNPELGDAPRHIQLFQREAAASFPDAPLWTPAIVAGRPLHANAQSALYGPFSLPLYVLPFWTALGWIALLKLWVAAFGTYLLGRALGMGFAGGLLAGLVFAFNLKLVTWLSYPHAGVWALIPWMLLAADRVVRRPDVLGAVGLAVATALGLLCGHPESSFHALLATLAFFALRLRQGVSLAVRPRLLALAAALAGGAALAAVTLVPFAELLWQSADLRERAGQSVDVHLPLQDAFGIFLTDWWGRPTQTPLRPFLLERALYVGALPLILAGVALVLRPTATRVATAVFGGLWLAVALGVPPFVQVVTRLPVFSSGHNTRLVILSMLALALLAGWGLDDLALRERFARRRRMLVVGALAVVAVPVAIGLAARGLDLGEFPDALRVAWLFADGPTLVTNPGHVAVIGQASMIVWVTLAGAAATLLVLRLGGRVGGGTFAVLALLLVVGDLFRAGMGYNPAIERRWAEVPETPAIGQLRRVAPARFVSTSEVPQNVIPMRFGPPEARGYDLPIIRRFDRLWRQEVDARSRGVAAGLLDIPLEFRDVTADSLRVLRLLGVRHVLQGATGRAATPPYEPEPAPPPLEGPGLRQVYEGRDARLYRVAGALPRAWVVARQRVVSGEDAALAGITRPGFDPRREVVTERRLAGIPDAGRGGKGGTGGLAAITEYRPGRVDLRATAPGSAVLVLSDVHYPGWRVEVDGEPADVERVDYLLRGVRIGPGEHTVSFRYRPLSWTVGWAVSALALIALVGALGLAARSRRSLSAGS